MAAGDPSSSLICFANEDGNSIYYNSSSKYWFTDDYNLIKMLMNHKDVLAAANGNLETDAKARQMIADHEEYAISARFFKSWLVSRNAAEQHGLYRSVFVRFMTFEKMKVLEGHMRLAAIKYLAEIKRELETTINSTDIDPAAGKHGNGIDLVEHLSEVLPACLTAKLLGFEPGEEMMKVKRWSHVFAKASTGSMSGGDKLKYATPSVLECRDHLLRKMAYRRHLRSSSSPQPSFERLLIDDILDAADNLPQGQKIPEEDLVGNLGMLMFASHDTLSLTITQSLCELIVNKPLRKEVESKFKELDKKVNNNNNNNTSNLNKKKVSNIKAKSQIAEEFVRVLGPTDCMARYAGSQITIVNNAIDKTYHIQPKQLIILDMFTASIRNTTMSINRYLPSQVSQTQQLEDSKASNSESQSQDQRDDLKNNSHLQFGYGKHICLGKNIAKICLAITIEEFLNTFAADEIELAVSYSELPRIRVRPGRERLIVVLPLALRHSKINSKL